MQPHPRFRGLRRLPSLPALLTLLAAVAPRAQGDVLAPTQLVSQTGAGQAGNNWSQWSSISHDGRFVAFTSFADDLVPGDTNGTYDVFVRDTWTGTTELISVSAAGGPSDGPSIMPGISADGRYVCFDSGTTNLVSPSVFGYFESYVRDRLTSTTEMVSVNAGGAQANNTTELSAISADGRFVAFGSYADNLVAGKPFNGFRDIFLRDRVALTTTLISTGPGGVLANSSSYESSISGDGRFVAFHSQADNLVPGGTTPGRQHIYLFDSQNGVVSLVSVDGNGVEANADSYKPALSADGRYLAFETYSTNILPGFGGGATVVVLRDLTNGAILDVNKDSLGQTIPWPTLQPTLSADGRFVSFGSGPLLPNQSGLRFVRDRLLGKTIAVCSMDDGSNPVVGAYAAWISGDGTTVALEATHALVAGVNNGTNVYVRGIGAPLRYCQAKINSQNCQPAIGSNGEVRVSNNYAATVRGTNALNNAIGILVHGLTGPLSAPFASGTLCVSPPFFRSQPTGSGGNPPPAVDCSGVWSLSLSNVIATSGIGPSVGLGSVLYLQWWGRDTGFAPPDAVQLSDGLQLVVGP